MDVTIEFVTNHGISTEFRIVRAECKFLVPQIPAYFPPLQMVQLSRRHYHE